MPIIRQPNQSYERNFGNIRLYLDDLDDVYRQLAECAETTIGVGRTASPQLSMICEIQIRLG